MLVALFCLITAWLLLGVLFELVHQQAGGPPTPARDLPLALTLGTGWTVVYCLYLFAMLLLLVFQQRRGGRVRAFVAAEERRQRTRTP